MPDILEQENHPFACHAKCFKKNKRSMLVVCLLSAVSGLNYRGDIQMLSSPEGPLSNLSLRSAHCFYIFFLSFRKFQWLCHVFLTLFILSPFFPGEEASVFKCSVSRETECSRVGKQSFIITLGCNSVLLQFSSPAGIHKHPKTKHCCLLYLRNTHVPRMSQVGSSVSLSPAGSVMISGSR